jgi:DnaJ-class molecular chaperone
LKKNLYTLLGIPNTATLEEIKRAYRKIAKQFHPDINPNNKEAEEKFKEATAAYEVLSDTTKRTAYDNQLKQEQIREEQLKQAERAKQKADKRVGWDVRQAKQSLGVSLGQVLFGVILCVLVIASFSALASNDKK